MYQLYKKTYQEIYMNIMEILNYKRIQQKLKILISKNLKKQAIKR